MRISLYLFLGLYIHIHEVYTFYNFLLFDDIKHFGPTKGGH